MIPKAGRGCVPISRQSTSIIANTGSLPLSFFDAIQRPRRRRRTGTRSTGGELMRAKRLPSSLRRNFDWHLFVARRNLSFAEKPGGATHAFCLSTVQHVGKRAPKFVA